MLCVQIKRLLFIKTTLEVCSFCVVLLSQMQFLCNMKPLFQIEVIALMKLSFLSSCIFFSRMLLRLLYMLLGVLLKMAPSSCMEKPDKWMQQKKMSLSVSNGKFFLRCEVYSGIKQLISFIKDFWSSFVNSGFSVSLALMSF